MLEPQYILLKLFSEGEKVMKIHKVSDWILSKD